MLRAAKCRGAAGGPVCGNRSADASKAMYVRFVGDLPDHPTLIRIGKNCFEQLPFLWQHIVLAQLGWTDDYRPSSRFENDIEALCSKEFHNLISSWMTAHGDVIRVYSRAIRKGDEILKIIKRELQAD